MISPIKSITEFNEILNKVVISPDRATAEDLQVLLGAKYDLQNMLFETARKVRSDKCGNYCWVRAVIEYSNRCSCKCLYCGMNAESAANIERYDLTDSGPEMLSSVISNVVDRGFKSIMLQSGEVVNYDFDQLSEIIRRNKDRYDDLKISVCIGTHGMSAYEKLRKAGVDLVILKFESTDEELLTYHRKGACKIDRMSFLRTLKSLGFQVSTGSICGLPRYAASVGGILKDPLSDLADGILWMREIGVQGASVSPFIPHADTIFKGEQIGDIDLALNTIAVMRIVLGDVLIPAVSAFNLFDNKDHENGASNQLHCLEAGANIVTVNQTPEQVRENYTVYTRDRRRVTLVDAKQLAQQAGLTFAFEEKGKPF